MRRKSTALILLILLVFQNSKVATFANEIPYEIPRVESFRPTQNSIDLSLEKKLTFELTVSHPGGIISTKTKLWFYTNDKRFLIDSTLFKVDSKVINSRNVSLFKGTVEIPNYFLPGLYEFYAEPIEGFSATNSKITPTTPNIYPVNFNTFPDGEKSIIIRVGGELNLDVRTFVGPSFNYDTYITDNKPRNFFTPPPITKVGETFDPEKFFEIRVKNTLLKIETFTPLVCLNRDNKLDFIATGNCNFRVYSEKNKDYLETSTKISLTITGARWKPEINTPMITQQTSKDLPKLLEISKAYTNTGELVSPVSLSPTVCLSAGQYWVRILSGGNCKLSYQSLETKDYLASDIQVVSFEITRDAQTISFTPPATANLSAKSLALSATASSAGVITFETTSTGICSITGATLNLLKSGNCSITATQAGTSTLAPISATSTVMITGSLAPVKKSITCVMGKKSKKVSGANPKCPKGYKLKK